MPERSEKVQAFVETMDRIADVMNQDIIDDAEELLEELPDLADGWPEVKPFIQCHSADVVNRGFDVLIEAFQIFKKYANPYAPLHCTHDTLMVTPDVSPSEITEEDRKRLEELGFFVGTEWPDNFISFRFGSC